MMEFLKRLSSRKFLITIAGLALVQLFPEYTEQIVWLIGIYVGSEGLADIVSRYAATTVHKAAIDKDISLIQAGEYNGDDADSKTIRPGTST